MFYFNNKLDVAYSAEVNISVEQIIDRLKQVKKYASENPAFSLRRIPDYSDITINGNIVEAHNIYSSKLFNKIPIGDLTIILSGNQGTTLAEVKFKHDSFQINAPLIGGFGGLLFLILFAWKNLFTVDVFSIIGIVIYTLFFICLVPLAIKNHRRLIKDYLQKLFHDLDVKADWNLTK